MTWFRVGGGSGVPASLKSRMNSVLNKKFGTSETDYPPNGWPDDVDLLGLLEEKTVSGAIANILDGADQVPTKNVIATIAPTQIGVSSVNVTRTGKNLLINNGVDTSGSGLSFVVNSDKSVTISGAATANAFFTFFENVLFKASSYMIRGSGNSNVQIIVRRETASGSNIRTASASDISWNLAEDTLCACIIRVASGTDLSTPITIYPQIEVGSSLSDYETAIFTTYTISLGRTIYGGTADIVIGEGTDENGNDFTFTGQRIETMLGVNNFWNDAGGETSVTYRSSGTMTPVTPTLITKTITANGTYQAAGDQADGYSAVVVNVSASVSSNPIMSLNAFVSKSGVSGTNTSTVVRSFTMSAAGKLVFASGSYGFTNTGSNDGYFEIQKNGVSVVKQYCNTSKNTPISIPEISVDENDVVDLVVGFDNAHSNCSFQFYSAMVVLSEV